ncbi:hypothetical protein M3Y99_00562200 [Aphelenchoides fujianensis]|nr:hypothetical protein M3Y99_00562200 [Aphelenchoides fujianensis]
MAVVAEALRAEMEKLEGAAQVMLSQNADPLQRRRGGELLPESAGGESAARLAQCLAVQLLRQWNAYTSDQLKAICKYLLEFPLTHPNLPPFAISELFKSAAVILKRGTVWRGEFITETVSQLLHSNEDSAQAMGLHIIEAICIETAALRRTGTSRSYIHHRGAKKNLEENQLLKFVQLVVELLQRLLTENADINQHLQVCDRFLKVAVLIFQWNFSATQISSYLKLQLHAADAYVTMRPPANWAPIFQDEALIPLFFELHRRVRGDHQLSQNSLFCVIQLGNVTGVALDSPGTQQKRERAVKRDRSAVLSHDLYVQRYIRQLINTFADCNPHEVMSLSMAIRVILNHSLNIFRRFPVDLMTHFVRFIVHWACTLAAPAMRQNKRSDDFGLMNAYANVLGGWMTLLNYNNFLSPIPQLIAEENNRVIESFLKAVLAPPFGERPATAAEAAEEDEELDDHRHYAVILADMGVFCRSSIEAFTQFVIKCFHERVNQRALVAQGGVSEAERFLWFEDMHWLLLMVAGFLQDSEREIAVRLDRGFKQKEWVLVDTPAVFSQALAQPDAFRAPDGADPITIICGMVAHWTGVLLHALETQGAGGPFVSAEICRSTVRTFAMTVNFLSSMVDDSSAAFFDESQSPELGLLPHLPATGDFSAALVDFEIRLCFAVFRAFPTEKLLCKTAVCFLLQESEKRASYIAKSPLLYEQLASITLEKLPSRADFMTCLVNVGANLATSQDRSQMHDQILQPLAARFLAVADAFQAGNTALASDLVDLLECMSGIAKAAQIESGNILYAYLLPILHSAVRLMGIAADSQPLVEAILDMFKNVATTLFIFVDAKRIGATALSEVEEEIQVADLVAVLQACTTLIMKSTAKKKTHELCKQLKAFCFKSLQMVVPILTEDSLRLSNLAAAFYRLIYVIAEITPSTFLLLDRATSQQLVDCLGWALSGAAGVEATRVSLVVVNMAARDSISETPRALPAFVAAVYPALLSKIFEIAFTSSEALDQETYAPSRHAVYSLMLADTNCFMDFATTIANQSDGAQQQERNIYHEFQIKFDKFVAAVEKHLVL